jgi:hypothetical protein
MTTSSYDPIAARFAKACADARRHLWAQMEQHGLREADGWKIAESIRAVQGGSELVMRPLHLRLQAPPWLECVVAIDEDTTAIESNCTPEA